MNFKYKCFLQKLFSNIPRGEIINYFFQKKIMKNLPISDDEFIIKVNDALKYYHQYNKYNKIKKNNAKNFYEFGAGYDLIIPFTMSLLNFSCVCNK